MFCVSRKCQFDENVTFQTEKAPISGEFVVDAAGNRRLWLPHQKWRGCFERRAAAVCRDADEVWIWIIKAWTE